MALVELVKRCVVVALVAGGLASISGAAHTEMVSTRQTKGAVLTGLAPGLYRYCSTGPCKADSHSNLARLTRNGAGYKLIEYIGDSKAVSMSYDITFRRNESVDQPESGIQATAFTIQYDSSGKKLYPKLGAYRLGGALLAPHGKFFILRRTMCSHHYDEIPRAIDVGAVVRVTMSGRYYESCLVENSDKSIDLVGGGLSFGGGAKHNFDYFHWISP